MTPALDATPIPGSPVVSGHLQTISQWTQAHALSMAESDRLQAVLTDYPPADVANELDEELRCILAARKLAAMPELTVADLERVQAAFDAGRIPFVAQDVD